MVNVKGLEATTNDLERLEIDVIGGKSS